MTHCHFLCLLLSCSTCSVLNEINLQNGNITQIGDSNTWEDVTEEYAVNKGIVYKLSDATVTKVDVQRCVGIYGADFPFALCEVK